MNYSLYLQSGGSVQTPTSDEQALAHQKQVDNQMAEAIKLNPTSLDQAIQDYGEDAPAFIKHMIDVAAENQDEQLLEILKPYAEKFNISSFRCGGKVRAKVKKAKCGKKMEKGGETPIKKEAKGGKPCPCTLHRVGGKLIEVDCNGIPVLKVADGNKIPPAQASPAVKAYMTAKPISSSMPLSDQWFGDLGRAFKSLFSSSSQPAEITKAPAQPSIGSEEWKAQQRANQEAYNKSPEENKRLLEKQDEVIAARKAAQPVQSKYQGLFNGDLRSLDARKKWVADNADYLKARGWTDEDIAGYRGQANLNMRLSGHINGANAWYAQQTQDLKEANSGLQRISALAAPVKVTPDAMTVSNPNQLGLDKKGNIVKLNTLTPGQALSGLSNSSWENYVNQTRLRILSSKSGGKLSYKDYINLK